MAFDSTKSFLHVHVVDTGTGIRRVDIPNLFAGVGILQHNNIISNQGAGLDLMISKNLVQINEGTIRVRSNGTD